MNETLPAPSRNGTHPAPTARRGRPRTAKPARVRRITPGRVKVAATVTTGVVIPLLSLGLSHVGGTLARAGHPALATFSLALMACVPAVSLDHLAWAIRDITRSPRWASWLLAIAFDLVLVLTELCGVSAGDAGVGTVTTLMMVSVAGLSMFLNVWAFLRHK